MKTFNKQIKITKKERKLRKNLKIGEFIDFLPDEVPEFEHLLVGGVKQCNICGYVSEHRFVICERCHNCQYCGGLSMNPNLSICDYCGNEIDHEAKIPTLHINI